MSRESESNLLTAVGAAKGMFQAFDQRHFDVDERNKVLIKGRDVLRANPEARRALGGDCYLDLRTADSERVALWIGWLAITLRDYYLVSKAAEEVSIIDAIVEDLERG